MTNEQNQQERELSARRRAFFCGRMRTWLELLILAFSGWLYAAIFPGWNWYPLAWIGLIPLFLICAGKTPLRAFLYGWFWGYVWCVSTFFFLREIFFLAPFFLCLLLGAFPGCWTLFLPFFVKNLLYPENVLLSEAEERKKFSAFSFPMELLTVLTLGGLWTVIEWVQSWILTGLPWNQLGSSLWCVPPMIQICEFTGVYGLSFLIASFNIALALWGIRIYRSGKYSRPYILFLLLALVALNTGFGTKRLKKYLNPGDSMVSLNAVLIQPHLSQRRAGGYFRTREAIEVCTSLTKDRLEARKGKEKADIVIWPESAVPVPYNIFDELSERFRNETARLIWNYRVPILTGAIYLEENKKNPKEFHVFNSALLLGEKGEVKDIYSKVHLVPFGEFVPLGDHFPVLNEIAGMGRNLTPGRAFLPMELKKGVRAGTVICYEDVFSYVTREHARNGANLLLVITNDAWYPASFEPEQHYSKSVFRTVETRLPMIRCGNSNYSAAVTPAGTLAGPFRKTGIGEQVRRSLSCRVDCPADPEMTFYTRFGDVFTGLCGIFVLAGTLTALFRWSGRKKALLYILKE